LQPLLLQNRIVSSVLYGCSVNNTDFQIGLLQGPSFVRCYHAKVAELTWKPIRYFKALPQTMLHLAKKIDSVQQLLYHNSRNLDMDAHRNLDYWSLGQSPLSFKLRSWTKVCRIAVQSAS